MNLGKAMDAPPPLWLLCNHSSMDPSTDRIAVLMGPWIILNDQYNENILA